MNFGREGVRRHPCALRGTRRIYPYTLMHFSGSWKSYGAQSTQYFPRGLSLELLCYILSSPATC